MLKDRLCAAPGCVTVLAGKLDIPMCPRHWHMVPSRLQELIRSNFDPREPAYPYLTLIAAAIGAVSLHKEAEA